MNKIKTAYIAALLFVPVFTIGCQSTPKYTQAQLNAIETRVVDADLDVQCGIECLV